MIPVLTSTEKTKEEDEEGYQKEMFSLDVLFYFLLFIFFNEMHLSLGI